MLQSTLGAALKGGEGGAGGREWCVAGENLLELERTKGGEGGGSGGAATETLLFIISEF